LHTYRSTKNFLKTSRFGLYDDEQLGDVDDVCKSLDDDGKTFGAHVAR